MPGRTQRLTKLCSAPALPDDSVVQCLAGAPVPQQCCFPLVGDTDTGNVCRFTDVLAQNGANALANRCPDICRTVFYPTGLRVDLGELVIDTRTQFACGVHQGDGTTRRTLIDREYKIGHR